MLIGVEYVLITFLSLHFIFIPTFCYLLIVLDRQAMAAWPPDCDVNDT